ncbi:hypothetical protein ACOMICROBIO_NCLOACGD_05350 [Vibrio sp. B1ASS3]|uniref:hypothetical protein n=1 Tax=Vibrio sp. B1ASS3 TaxID=2751176 RepID=UPI001ABACD23|nr:hypothetical protein [Vibrio sp. B1ASS3]CAD7827472.1 hypothetical protein ACOMICROBIO_NCLOACGD_05350 [Vibrio sp. B1ASS3]CAE6964654.1 hypothetical protein ACOMICROBIO_NCLOACGD_05350 [Vibrio sp. B1ASS3]
MFKTFPLFILILTSLSAEATLLKGKLEGVAFHWKNAQQISGSGVTEFFVPSQWNVATGLAPTTEFVLGGVANLPPTEITLSFGSERVNVPMTVVGFEYNLGDLGSKVKIGPTESGPICNSYGTHSSHLGLYGGAYCTYSNSYMINSGAAYNPYSFIRPIVSLDISELGKAFKGKSKGVYVGSLSVTSFYDYYVPSNGIRTRQYKPENVAVQIEYEPGYVTDVMVVGDENIAPFYDLLSNTVSGYTSYSLNAKGWFLNGLKLSLKPLRTKYEMIGPVGATIPYSVECFGCDTQSLVKQGYVINKDVHISGTNTTNIGFDIKISYEDIDLGAIEDGEYLDVLVLMVEPAF